MFKQLVGESKESKEILSSASDSLGISHVLSLGGVMLIPSFTDLRDLTLLTVVHIKLCHVVPDVAFLFNVLCMMGVAVIWKALFNG